MIFPVKTDRPPRHTPWVNYTLILVNVLVALWLVGQHGAFRTPAADPFLLYPADPRWYQFFTYQFLHGSGTHLLFNMLFLWVFGNSVEDRLGPVGYLSFYLAGGVLAGLGHSVMEPNPVLGASGSVSAVTGAYLALFPMTRVTLVYWFIIIGWFEIPSMWLILLSFGQDLLFSFMDVGNVAYLAHLTGSVYGFAVGMTLLWTRILPREPFDFLALLTRWRRRRQLAALTRRGDSPWLGDPGKAVLAADDEPDEDKQRIMRLRGQIGDALATHDGPRAARLYEQLVEVDARQTLPRQAQLDVANFAMHETHYALAARAYERFMAAYPSDEYRPQVELILGLIYARYLNAADRARPLLTAAVENLEDEQQRAMAREVLAEIGAEPTGESP